MRTLTILIITISFLFSACNTSQPKLKDKQIKDPEPIINESQKNIDKTSKSLKQSSEKTKKAGQNINKEASDIKNKTSLDTQKKINPNLHTIQNEAGLIVRESNHIFDEAMALSETNTKLNNAKKQTNKLKDRNRQLEKQLKNKDKKIESIRNKQNKQLKQYLYYIILAGVCIVAVGISLFVTGNPKAIAGAVGGMVLIGVSFGVLMLTQYQWIFGWLFGAGALAIIAIVIYHVWDYINNKRGFEETIDTIEEAKKLMDPDLVEHIFGSKNKGGIADKKQSKSTRNRIREIKNKKKKKE